MNIINFSGGRTSAYMTKRLIDEGGEYLVTFQNTGKEMPQTLDFINECDKRWGLNIVRSQYRDWETDRKSTRLNSSHRL